MSSFDQWPAMQEFSFKEFSFPVDRYEEWVEGERVSSGRVKFNIVFKDKRHVLFFKDNIKVEFDENKVGDKILSKFDFDKALTSGDRFLFFTAAKSSNVENMSINWLSHIAGFTRKSKMYSSNEPVIGSVFTINHDVAKVSFTFGNGNRLIEFY